MFPFLKIICRHSNNILHSVVFSSVWKCENNFYWSTWKLKKYRSSSEKKLLLNVFSLHFSLNKYIFLISSFFKTHFKINFNWWFLFIYLLYFSFWVGISLEISQGTKEDPFILAQGSRWEIINNILEPEERKSLNDRLPYSSIYTSNYLECLTLKSLNPFTLLFYLKPEKSTR